METEARIVASPTGTMERVFTAEGFDPDRVRPRPGKEPRSLTASHWTTSGAACKAWPETFSFPSVQLLFYRITQGEKVASRVSSMSRRIALTEKSNQSQRSRSVFFHHRITLSARTSTFGGIVRPISFAVFRFMTRSILSIPSTGKSFRFNPGKKNLLDVFRLNAANLVEADTVGDEASLNDFNRKVDHSRQPQVPCRVDDQLGLVTRQRV